MAWTSRGQEIGASMSNPRDSFQDFSRELLGIEVSPVLAIDASIEPIQFRGLDTMPIMDNKGIGSTIASNVIESMTTDNDND